MKSVAMNGVIDSTTQTKDSIAQNLPFDVLQEIFRAYLPSYSDDPSCPSNTFQEVILLCHICGPWRMAILCMHSFWISAKFTLRTIRANDSTMILYLLPSTSRFIAWWIQHLNNVPPSIHLAYPENGHKRHSTNSMKLYENAYTGLFGGSFFRSARSLSLVLLNQELDIICSDSTFFPNLVDLRIESHIDYRMPRIAGFPFPHAPLLTRLHFAHCESFESRALNIFPWSQLTHLYLPRTISSKCWKLLARICTQLKLAAVILCPPTPPTEDIVVMKKLQQLVLASNDIPASASLTGLSFPYLSALRIISTHGTDPLLNITHITSLLKSTPALAELHFDSSLSFSDHNFITFDSPANQDETILSALVPHLKILVIDFIDPSRESVGHNIIRFLKSQWLCSGWGGETPRHLKMIVRNDSFYELEPIPAEIIEEVKGYLGNEWGNDMPFLVTIQDEESLANCWRNQFDVFDERLPSRGWDLAVDFDML